MDPEFLTRLNRVKPTTYAELAKIWYGTHDWERHALTHYDSSRYHLLNLHSVFQKGTIEFRAFNSTLHAGEVEAYIQLCMAISALSSQIKRGQSTQNHHRQPQIHLPMLASTAGLHWRRIQDRSEHLLKHLPGNSAWRQAS